MGVLGWNGTLDQNKIAGDPALDRRVTVRVDNLPDGEFTVRHWRIDEQHSNVFGAWNRMSGGHRDWPDAEEWEALRAANRLEELQELYVARSQAGALEVAFDLPQPGISLVELDPVH